MTDMIDRQAALNVPVIPKEHRNYRTYNLDDVYEDGWNDALACVGEAPIVDAVSVVRCKDCKWSDWYTTFDGNVYGACMYTQISGLREMDYCSRGRRKGGGDGSN